jgi:hypothetical protein
MGGASALDNLEQRASAQRDHLDKAALELHAKLSVARESLNLSHHLRAHFSSLSGVLSVLGFALGYVAANPSRQR